MAKHFTPEEANEALPRVRALVAQILTARQKIVTNYPELEPVFNHAVGNGGSKKASDMIVEFKRIEGNAKILQDLGVVLKDLSTGLVDFPSIRDGREVLLCWKYDEASVAYWHDLQSGFAGRQRL
ncbi:MAG TPA: DUF2203 domain-containing protein [Anaerolineae bacterium]|nr:DUF2203 domain-containing protein [Anaerolineae bacterium]